MCLNIEKIAEPKKAKPPTLGTLKHVEYLTVSVSKDKGGPIEIAGLDAYFGESARTISILPKI